MSDAFGDAAKVRSNSFSLQWLPKSGRMQQFPEVDRAQWFSLPEARKRINKGQIPLLDQLISLMGLSGEPNTNEPI